MTNDIIGSDGEGDGPSEDKHVDGEMRKVVRALTGLLGGAIPLIGPFVQAANGYWSEKEQSNAMDAIRALIRILEDESREKQKTIVEILSRLDFQDEEIAARVRSADYQNLLKKAFRGWSRTESQSKQEYIRNILSNAAACKLVIDEVVSLFLEWIQDYSDFHFQVIAQIYRKPGSTRGMIWRDLGKARVREDVAEADLFKLLIRDLSMGSIIRQHRETNYIGQFIAKQPVKAAPKGSTKEMKSAFDEVEKYELTDLGGQFVHYAMTDLPLKLTYDVESGDPSTPRETPSTR